MAKKKRDSSPEQLESVEQALTRTERFIEKNQQLLTYIVTGIVAVVAIYLGFKRFYLNPKELDAQSLMFTAEQYFERDSLQFALNGDGSNFGFYDIIDEYGLTKSANLAKYYAGIALLRLGEYKEAIDYLKQFKKKDKMIGVIALGAIGDAYSQLGELKKAAVYYLDAANYENNEFASPIYLMKAGQVYEELGEFNKALNAYNRIEKEYPNSMEARNIEKYITRAETLVSGN
ncbi:tol-pal system YbgF family protein [Bacteroidota bacterium]